jgi:hypothetical protein
MSTLTGPYPELNPDADEKVFTYLGKFTGFGGFTNSQTSAYTSSYSPGVLGVMNRNSSQNSSTLFFSSKPFELKLV